MRVIFIVGAMSVLIVGMTFSLTHVMESATSRKLADDGGDACLAPWEEYAQGATLDDNVVVYWNLYQHSLDLAVIFTSGQGWGGFGFNDESLMLGAEIVLGSQGDMPGAFKLVAMQSPVLGTSSQRITNASWEVDGIHGTLKFSRNFDNGGSIDLTPRASPQAIIAAWGSEDFCYHRWYKFGGSLDFETCEVVPNRLDQMKLAHGVLQTWAYGLQFPVGMMLARYFREVKETIQLHQALQVCAVLLGTLAFILGLMVMQTAAIPIHGYVGFAIFGATCLQLFLGASKHFVDWTRYIYLAAIHRYNGRLLVAAGLVNVWVGLLLYSYEEGYTHDAFGLRSLNVIFAIGLLISLAVLERDKYLKRKHIRRDLLLNNTTTW